MQELQALKKTIEDMRQEHNKFVDYFKNYKTEEQKPTSLDYTITTSNTGTFTIDTTTTDYKLNNVSTGITTINTNGFPGLTSDRIIFTPNIQIKDTIGTQPWINYPPDYVQPQWPQQRDYDWIKKQIDQITGETSIESDEKQVELLEQQVAALKIRIKEKKIQKVKAKLLEEISKLINIDENLNLIVQGRRNVNSAELGRKIHEKLSELVDQEKPLDKIEDLGF